MRLVHPHRAGIHPIRLLAYGIVIVRYVVGLLFLVAPRRTMKTLFGSAGTSRAARLTAGGYAVRDVALGYGLYRSLRRSRNEAAWMLTGTAADAVDFAAVLATRKKRTTGQVAMIGGMAGIVVTDAILTAIIAKSHRHTPL